MRRLIESTHVIDDAPQLELTNVTQFSNGVVILIYRPRSS